MKRISQKMIGYTSLALVVCLILIFSIGTQEIIFKSIYIAEGYMEHTPLLGALLFLVLSAISVPMAFLSGLLLLPSALLAWGPSTTFILLFLGWILGSIATYGVGRLFGKVTVKKIAQNEKLSRYADHISHKTPLWQIALLVIIVPEVSGYLLGIIRFSFSRYLMAIVLAEFPLALISVLAGEEFLEKRFIQFFAIVIVIILGSWYIIRKMRREYFGSRNKTKEI